MSAGDADDADVEGLIARRRAARRRGTPPGREPLPGRGRTLRLAGVTTALLIACSLVLAAVLLAGG